ncbi:hypothetical protein HOP38_02525 [Vibrio mediterranei]|uniref:hypothetical protein n=1 Tax=Vibrio mediterranei TaxID=689 RepID=UPI0018194818|nr:hypothetical protein [Vibrio mediterranei]NUW71387.1 hypothetical protein [Vibrio mediterranei]
MNSKTVVILGLALVLAGCGGGGGDPAPKSANIDYPLDYGATLFPDVTESKISYQIGFEVKEGSKKPIANENIWITNEIKPNLDQINNLATRWKTYGTDLFTMADLFKATVKAELIDAIVCLDSKTNNAMPNSPSMVCSNESNGVRETVSLTAIGFANSYTDDGKVYQEKLYQLNTRVRGPGSVMDFPVLRLGLHQGIGLTSVDLIDTKVFEGTDYWIYDFRYSWFTTDSYLM